MAHYIAQLLKPIHTTVTFESTDCTTGTKFAVYTVPHTKDAGFYRFKTRAKALAWVAMINREYGNDTAIFSNAK